ncbi:MAG: hypothetical protein VYA55_15740 [Pseudomonadota bacterium]|nr:hypothetical protein [Pseudomonadota bacterium]
MIRLFNIELGGSLRYTDRGVALYKDIFYKAGIDIQEIRTLKDHQRACDISRVDSVLNEIFQNRHLNPATGKPSLLAEAVNELLSGDGDAEKFLDLSSDWIRRAEKLKLVE